MRKLLHLALLTLAASAAPHLATAGTATASASISGLSWRLIDLDPNDGIAPSISFSALAADGSMRLAVSEAAVAAQLLGTEEILRASAPAPFGSFGPMSKSLAGVGEASAVGTAASALVTASSTTPILRPDQDGLAADSFAAVSLADEQRLPWCSGWCPNFTLSARTMLVVEATGSASAHLPGDAGADDEAQAQVSLALIGNTSAGGSPFGRQTAYDEIEFRLEGPGTQDGSLLNQAMLVSFENGTGADMTGLLLVRTWASTTLYGVVDPTGMLTPVPEPGTWALMLAGLGIVGLGARQRSRGGRRG